MASVEDYPYAELKYMDSMNGNVLGYHMNPEIISLDTFDNMDEMNTNMAYLEEPSSLIAMPMAQQMTFNQPSMVFPVTPNNNQMPVDYMMRPQQQQQHQQQHQHQQLHQHQQHQQQHQQLLQPPLTHTQNQLNYSFPEQHQQPQQQQMPLTSQFELMDDDLVYTQHSQFIQAPIPFDGFPPVHAFVPPLSTPVQSTHEMESFETPQRVRNLSEADILETLQNDYNDSPLSLSPESIVGSSTDLTYSTAPSTTDDSNVSFNRYKVIRGISSGGSATKPPRSVTLSNHHYAPVNLELVGAALQELCLPQWSEAEKMDRRRIIRVERYQIGPRILAQFSIVGSAKENPKTKAAPKGVDVVEVSCLECFTGANDDEDEGSENEYGYKTEAGIKRAFYITSVEVIKVVELLIGTEVQEPVERRRERGRIRSNLVPFWSKRPISSRMSTIEGRSSPLSNDGNVDFRVELATRIMSYDIRKPRGFDKEVRILKWEKLVPALKRALQSYYVEVPDTFEEIDS